jgi:hypothetical protein
MCIWNFFAAKWITSQFTELKYQHFLCYWLCQSLWSGNWNSLAGVSGSGSHTLASAELQSSGSCPWLEDPLPVQVYSWLLVGGLSSLLPGNLPKAAHDEIASFPWSKLSQRQINRQTDINQNRKMSQSHQKKTALLFRTERCCLL